MYYYICHKCSGLLSPCEDIHPYHCGCISGYVRDFYVSITLDAVITAQIFESKERLKLYRKQGRLETGDHIRDTLADLARLETYRRIV